MIIDGKKIAEEMLAEVAEEVKTLQAVQGRPPRLAAVLVEGPHLEVQPPSGVRRFLELKKKAAEKIGIDFRIYEFPASITTQKLRKEIVGIAKTGVNHGVLVELPLPAHINTQYALNAISQEKDVDVLSEKSQGAFFVGRSVILPPAVEAVKIIFEKHDINTEGKNCTIFGYGLLVGKPISHWLAQRGATVSIENEFTLDPKRHTLSADIIISGVGKPNLIKANMVKDRAVVIDFGYTTCLEGAKLAIGGSPEHFVKQNVLGDVDFDEVSKKAGWITPVPGGVGPIVIAAVLKNLLTLYKTRMK